MKPLFALGQIVATPGVLESVARTDVLKALGRHALGDWGEVCGQDRQTNDEALLHGFQLLSAYQSETGTKFWIITEGDRSVTTILLPDEY